MIERVSFAWGIGAASQGGACRGHCPRSAAPLSVGLPLVWTRVQCPVWILARTPQRWCRVGEHCGTRLLVGGGWLGVGFASFAIDGNVWDIEGEECEHWKNRLWMLLLLLLSSSYSSQFYYYCTRYGQEIAQRSCSDLHTLVSTIWSLVKDKMLDTNAVHNLSSPLTVANKVRLKYQHRRLDKPPFPTSNIVTSSSALLLVLLRLIYHWTIFIGLKCNTSLFHRLEVHFPFVYIL